MNNSITCSVTGKTIECKSRLDGSEKLPRGWKRIGGEIVSPDGYDSSFVRRVILLPIHKPIDEGFGWKELGDIANECFRETCRMANLAMRMYAASDLTPPSGESGRMKLAAWKPSNSVYAKCREMCPGYPSGSLTDLLQRLQGIYAKSRFEMMVTCRKSLPSFASGRLPMGVRAQNWKAGRSEDGELLCTFTLGSNLAGDLRRGPKTVMLRRSNHQAHAAVYERIVSGEIQAADLKIKPCRDGLAVAVTVNLPRKIRIEGEATLMVRTDPQSLLIWTVAGKEDRPPLHCDQIKKMVAAQDAQRQRLADDLKFDKRYPAHVRRRIVHRRAKALRKWENRRVNAIREAASLTIKFAVRNRLKNLVYDDSDRNFLPRFAWAELSACISDMAAKENIDFLAAPAGPKGDQGNGPAHADNSAVSQPPKPSP